jgi:tetratricopeptide (TPR) repeat protein
LQQWIENLYAMRDDASAVLWTYHDFRRAHHDTDTHNAAQVAGYQMLKMTAIPAALALLEANAADYPTTADAHFALGRALNTAGQPAKAKTELQRALALDPAHKRAAEALNGLR